MVCQKQKYIDYEVQNLKRRKLELQTNIDSLCAFADQLVQRAETSQDFTLIVKSSTSQVNEVPPT